MHPRRCEDRSRRRVRDGESVFSLWCAICEVEVDPDTGVVEMSAIRRSIDVGAPSIR